MPPSSPRTLMGVVDGEIRDWLAGLSRRELGAALLAVLVALGAAAAWYVRSLPRPVTVEPAAREGPVAGPTPSVDTAPLVVHVAGWVRRPGVYELLSGDRVIDALEAAGGARPGAQLDALNLAAPLIDGQQVLVSGKGEGVVSVGAGSAPPATTTALVNVNTADAATLETLPGIGEVLAATIIGYREENGPFSAVEELLEVSGIGEVTLEELRDLVTV